MRRWLIASLLGLAGLPLPRAHAQPADASPALGSAYLVRPGDTLWGLSLKYMESASRWPELQRANAVPVPERLRVGQLLYLGGGSAAVLHVSGNVLLRRGAGPSEPLAAGTTLTPGDLLTTSRDSFLTLGFADGSRVVMPSSSSARLIEAHGRRTRLELLDGRVESYVEKRKDREFEIRTRSYALGVKGTHFRVRSEGGVQTLEVLEGEVQATELGGGRSAHVAALEGAPLGGAGSALAVRSLLPPPAQGAPTSRNTVVAQSVAGATAYRLQLASDASFQRLAAESRAQAPHFTLQGSLATGFYHTRVSALDAQGVEGQASEGVTFMAPPQAPMSSGARAVDNGRWEIRWTARQARRHTFELASTPDFASPLVAESGSYVNGVTVGPLEGPARYYWRCREQAEGESSLPTEWGGSFETTPP